MIVVILLIMLTIVLPLVILRSFSFLQKVLVLTIIAGHLGLMFFFHYQLVHKTNLPVVVDVHRDTQHYYDSTIPFATKPPFSITRTDAINAAGGSKHFGYQYVLATLCTITSHPILAVRLLKTMLFFTGLSCLARVWRRLYGYVLAAKGFAFMGIVCTPAFYYNYRNLKDGLILALFLFIMALLDTILPPWRDQLRPMSRKKSTLAWFTVIILLYAISTLRLYVIPLIVMAIVMHAIVTSRLGLKQRVALLVVSALVVVIGFASPVVADISEMYGKAVRKLIFTPIDIVQGLISPLPWGDIVREEPGNVAFYSIYWLLLPYALYTLVRHLRKNINWRLFLYLSTTYVIGVTVANPARKRLILYPVLVTWVLAHLAYKQWRRAERLEYESEAGLYEPYYPEYPGDDFQPEPDKEAALNIV